MYAHSDGPEFLRYRGRYYFRFSTHVWATRLLAYPAEVPDQLATTMRVPCSKKAESVSW
jgi:hypothetical protein